MTFIYIGYIIKLKRGNMNNKVGGVTGSNSNAQQMYELALNKLKEAQEKAASAPPDKKDIAESMLTRAESIFTTAQQRLNGNGQQRPDNTLGNMLNGQRDWS
jgi:hypothetical protein